MLRLFHIVLTLIVSTRCPIDDNIMPKFEYTNNSTRAAVSFPAHKFPHTSSVYYQCNVRLCINNGGCNLADCNGTNSSIVNGGPRRKRFVGHDQQQQAMDINGDSPVESLSELKPSALVAPSPVDSTNMSFDVYSGLYVNDIDIGGKYGAEANLSKTSRVRF